MGIVTMVYTWFGGFKAVVWTDVLQLTVYLAGGVGGAASSPGIWPAARDVALALARRRRQAPASSTRATASPTPTRCWAGSWAARMLSAASHGTDHLIVQRLLATRSLRDARVALVGSGVMVILQFTLFLLVGSAIWAAGLAPAAMPSDQLFPAFVVDHLPAGLAGLVIAGILAAAMGTHSSAINSLASSATHDLYAVVDRAHATRGICSGSAADLAPSGRWRSSAARCSSTRTGGHGQTPVVVLALSIASVTYGPLLGTYFLAGRWPRARGRDVVGGGRGHRAVMLVVVFAKRLPAHPGSTGSSPLGRLAWPWYVPLGTLLAVGSGMALSYRSGAGGHALIRGSERMTRILIGADVGGTKTAVAVSDGDTMIIGRAEGPGAARPAGPRAGVGRRSSPMSSARRSRARRQAQRATCSWSGAAGAGREPERDELQHALRGENAGRATVVVTTDIEIALAGAFGDGPGHRHQRRHGQRGGRPGRRGRPAPRRAGTAGRWGTREAATPSAARRSAR